MPTRVPSAGIVFPSSSLTKGPLEVLRGNGVHDLAALDVVLHRDPRVGVPEELGGEERVLRVVDDRGDGAAEAVRGDVLDPGRVHHVAQEPTDTLTSARRHHRTENEPCHHGDWGNVRYAHPIASPREH
jgi:hypothetical protein